MKVAIVSSRVPPASSGQAMMLYRLLKDVNPEQYCFLSTMSPDTPGENHSRRLPGKYFHISTAGELTRGYRFGLSVPREIFSVSLGAFMRARQIARTCRQEGCEAIMSCSSGDDLLDVPSGFIASRLTGVPFYLYLFDTYSHMWAQATLKALGRYVEAPVLRGAKGIVATNEWVRDLLRTRHGVDAIVIHNPCDLSEYEMVSRGTPPRRDGEIRVVYTGAVSIFHYDAFRNLVSAIERLGRPDIKLHLYGAVSAATLVAHGIRGPVMHHGHHPLSAMPAIQHQADILFLPLTFRSPDPELVRVSSPSKIGEFLASRRPILVHAPPDSFLSTYFRRHDCGLVVDRDDPEALAEAIEQLLSDEDLQRRLGAHAWERAVSDFSLEVAQASFRDFLKLERPN